MGFHFWIWAAGSVCLFWGVGMYNRVTRIRARSLESFVAVAEHLLQFRRLVVEHVDLARIAETPPAFQQLLRQLDGMDMATQAAKLRAWDPELLSAVNFSVTEAMVTWSTLRTAPGDLAGPALPDRLVQNWQVNNRALSIVGASFNQVLMGYNEAISQFPAVMISNFLGFKQAGQMATFHEE